MSGKRPPYFTTYAEVEVEIDPKDLERAGWVHVGKDQQVTTATALDIVERWHYETHPGPWRFCPESPCDDLRGRECAA